MTLGNPPEQIIKFPCQYPITVMGLNNEAFSSIVIKIVQKHLQTDAFEQSSKQSKGGKYLSLTFTFTARSREQLDSLYHELNDHDLVVMTL